MSHRGQLSSHLVPSNSRALSFTVPALLPFHPGASLILSYPTLSIFHILVCSSLTFSFNRSCLCFHRHLVFVLLFPLLPLMGALLWKASPWSLYCWEITSSHTSAAAMKPYSCPHAGIHSMTALAMLSLCIFPKDKNLLLTWV